MEKQKKDKNLWLFSLKYFFNFIKSFVYSIFKFFALLSLKELYTKNGYKYLKKQVYIFLGRYIAI